MATVGISKDLINRVETKINGMRKAERSSDLPNIDKNYSIDASMLYNIGCWGAQHVHLLNLIPKDWLSKTTDSSITIAGWTDEEVPRNIKASVRFTGMTFAYHRPKDNYYAKSDSELTLDEVRAFPEEAPGRAELLQRWDDAVIEKAIDARWEKVKTDITEFLGKCKSLNEAVKLFPGVRMYIHYEDLERLDRKAERPTQRAKIVEAVDTEGLTAAAIAAKLAMAA
jgi:hypothetical protein